MLSEYIFMVDAVTAISFKKMPHKILLIINERIEAMARYFKNIHISAPDLKIENICNTTHIPPVANIALIADMISGSQVAREVIFVISKKESISVKQSFSEKLLSFDITPDSISIAPVLVRNTLKTEKATIIVHI